VVANIILAFPDRLDPELDALAFVAQAPSEIISAATQIVEGKQNSFTRFSSISTLLFERPSGWSNRQLKRF
jgi:hypothetical protein